MFSGRPSVSVSVRACMRRHPGATLERVEAFRPKLTRIFHTTARGTDYVSKVDGSRSNIIVSYCGWLRRLHRRSESKNHLVSKIE